MPVTPASKSILLPDEIAMKHDVQFLVHSRLIGTDLNTLNRNLEAHLAHMASLISKGILPISGPFFTEDGKNTGNGFYVLKVASIDEARSLASEDPLHKRGIRSFHVEPWLQVIN